MTFDALYEKYHSELMRYARKLMREECGAEDLFQDTMYRIYDNWDKFDHKTNIQTRDWVYTVMYSIFINYWRKKKIEVRNVDNVEDIVKDFKNPENIFNIKQRYSKIIKIIENLPNGFKDACKLCFIDERSYKEIAEILNIPLGTVGSKIHRIRKIVEYMDKNNKITPHYKITDKGRNWDINFSTDPIDNITVFRNFTEAKSKLLAIMREKKNKSSKSRMYYGTIKKIRYLKKEEWLNGKSNNYFEEIKEITYKNGIE